MRLTTLLENKDHFTDNEKIIADYILSHKDEVLNISIQALAKQTYTSTSAVMRLCSRMHVSGFKEFKIVFAQEMNHPMDTQDDIDPNFPFSRNDGAGEIATQIEKLTVLSLEEARQSMSISDVRKACALMQAASSVALFGIGDAYLAGLSFVARMTRTGVNYLTTPVYGEQMHLAQSLNRGDCGLLLSYSGTTMETVEVAKRLKKKGVSTICITADAQSPLAKLADITLLLPAKETKFHRIASFFSQTCMDYYLNVIYSILYVTNDHAKEHRF